MIKYYHVIKKHGIWYLYAGNATNSLSSSPDRSAVMRAARALSRHDGARIVVHKDHSIEQETHQSTRTALSRVEPSRSEWRDGQLA